MAETGDGISSVEASNWNRSLQTIASHFRFHPAWRPYRRQRRFRFRSIVNPGSTKLRRCYRNFRPILGHDAAWKSSLKKSLEVYIIIAKRSSRGSCRITVNADRLLVTELLQPTSKTTATKALCSVNSYNIDVGFGTVRKCTYPEFAVSLAFEKFRCCFHFQFARVANNKFRTYSNAIKSLVRRSDEHGYEMTDTNE